MKFEYPINSSQNQIKCLFFLGALIDPHFPIGLYFRQKAES